MAAWLKVFCTRPVRHVTDKDILTGFDFTDPYTLAETYGIEDENLVDQALAWLRITQAAGASRCIGMWYLPPPSRPVLLHLGGDAQQIQQERDEALEGLEEVKGPGVAEVRRKLERTVDIAAFELAWGQTGSMGIVLAGQAAEYLARLGVGVIRDQNERWWRMEGDDPVLLYPE